VGRTELKLRPYFWRGFAAEEAGGRQGVEERGGGGWEVEVGVGVWGMAERGTDGAKAASLLLAGLRR